MIKKVMIIVSIMCHSFLASDGDNKVLMSKNKIVPVLHNNIIITYYTVRKSQSFNDFKASCAQSIDPSLKEVISYGCINGHFCFLMRDQEGVYRRSWFTAIDPKNRPFRDIVPLEEPAYKYKESVICTINQWITNQKKYPQETCPVVDYKTVDSL